MGSGASCVLFGGTGLAGAPSEADEAGDERAEAETADESVGAAAP